MQIVRGLVASTIAIGAALLLGGVAPHASAEEAGTRHGFAFMDVTDRAAVFWTRAGAPGEVELELTDPAGVLRTERVAVDLEADRTATKRLVDLVADTRYEVRVRLPSARGNTQTLTGSLRTAPKRTAAAPLVLAFGGDVGGQNVCRDAERGMPLLSVIARRTPDLFVGLGDMIYADDACRETGRYGNAQVPGPIEPAQDLAGMRARWHYNRSDPGWIDLSARIPYVPVWDDHEVVNDLGPAHDSLPGRPEVRLMAPGLRAFLENNPIARHSGSRLHRRLSWGRHLDLFVLDTRQYRASNALEDSFELPKSMLGRDQVEWFLASATISDATWKVVVSSVPIGIPTGAIPDPATGRDGWANYDQKTGFENELRQLLLNLHDGGVRNLVWITTDIHFASVQRYRPFKRFPDFVVHEVATGPLNAGVFPNDLLDESFRPERLFRWPPLSEGADGPAIESFDDALRWFNFGELAIDADGNLTVRVVNGAGDVVYEHTLTPVPSPPARPGS